MYFTFKWSATIIISWVVLVKAEPYIKKGKCGISGKCGSEAKCVQFQSNWYICMCPQENSDPTKDLKCLTWTGLKISPDLPEYTLTSNSTEDDRVFTCKGNEPVQWYFEQYDGSLLEKNNKLIKNILTKDKNNYTYSASFSLARPTYLDTGYYYCAPLSAEEKLIKLFKKIYIFIKQEPYLFAFPDDYNKIKFNDINGIQSTIIPCRPTSPDIKIELFQNEDWVKNVSDSFYYNEKIGLILLNDGWDENKNFTCIATKNSITRKQQFIYDVIKSFRINNGYSDYVVSGQNVTLNCSSTQYVSHKNNLITWIVSKKTKHDTNIIYIHNVTTKDEDSYICEVRRMNITLHETSYFNISYDLKVIAPNDTYINLVILDDTNKKIRPAEYHSVCWKVHVSAYPNASLEWRNPEGNKIETKEEKIHVENDNRSSQLCINDLKLLDFGIYKLTAYSGAKKNEINVTLVVEDKPKVESINSSKSGVLYCNIGKICKFEFLVSGYPLPLAKWTYTNCTNHTSTECVTDIPITVKNISLTPVTQKYIITLFFIENGTLTCNVSNTFGKSIEEYSVIPHSAEDQIFLSDGNSLMSYITYILLIISVVIIFSGVLWLIIKRKSKQKVAAYYKKGFEMGTVERWNPNLEVVDQAYLLPYDNRWEIPIDKIELGEQLGSGAFGIVYKAKVTGMFNGDTTNTVALKTIKPTANPCHKMALDTELKILTNLGRHLNIVNLLGACTVQMNKKPMLIFEYCCFGSIDRYLQKHRAGFINQITPDGFIDYDIEIVSNISKACDVTGVQVSTDGHQFLHKVQLKECLSPKNNHTKYSNTYKPLCTNDLLCWSYQVSIGMDYLANRKIIHGDLATRNILLAEDNVVKICDFGLAKNMYNNEIYKMSKKTFLPIKWLSIESMRDNIFSTASDVWTFGIVLWEIFSLAAVPYPNVQLDYLLNKLLEGYRMERPVYSNSKIYDVMLDCWKTEPTERPSFSDIAVRLGDLLQECTKSNYVELNEHHEKMYSEVLPLTDTLGILANTSSRNFLNTPQNYTESSRNKSDHYTNIDDFKL